MKYFSSHDKFESAIRTLAVGKYGIRDRLCDAYRYYLMHIKENELPQESVGTFQEIKVQLTSGETIEEIIDAMDADQASMIAGKIVDIFHQVADK